MDNIQHLSAFQGVILSADNFYSFAKLKSKGGNEEKVKYVLEKLFNFLKEKNYITENGVVKENYGEYQKLALFIVLNADLPILEEMTEMDGMEAVIWMLPTVPAYLLTELFWNLHMQDFLYQIIAFCDPNLGLQVADAFIANMKYLDPVEHLDRVRIVAGALYRLVCRLHFFGGGAALLPAARARFRAALDHIAAPARPERLLALTRDRHYRHLGRSLALMLRLVDECLGHFTALQRFEDEGFADIYLATHRPETIETRTLDFKICDSPDRAISECLHECNTFLLDDCMTRVMGVSVDIFCAWSEYEERGGTMQQTIGESCYRIGSVLQSIAGISDHALVGMLKQISRKPVNIEDIIEDAAVEDIAERVNARDADSGAWLAAALRRADLCRQPELLRLVETRLVDTTEEQAEELYHAIVRHLQNDNSNERYLKVLAIKAFRRCSDAVQEHIVDEQFRDHFHDDMECAEYEDMLTDTLNRLTRAPGAEPGALLPVFLQNPKRTLIRLFRAAGENAKQTDIMLDAMQKLAKYSSRYYRRSTQPCVVAAALAALAAADDAAAPDARRDCLLRFLTELKRRGLLSGNRLLVQVAMPHLHAALLARDARALFVSARLLRDALRDAGELKAARAPLLAAAAQALDAARVPPPAFTPLAPLAIEQFIRLKDQLIDTYEDKIPEAELQWLRGRLSRATPLTRALFARLLPLAPTTHALQHRVQQNAMAVLTLCPLEWVSLLCGDDAGSAGAGAGAGAVRAAGAALLAATRALTLTQQPEPDHNSWACLLHAHACFATTIKKHYFSQPPTDEQVTTVIDVLEQLADGVAAAAAAAADAAEQLAAAWLPLLAHVAAARPALRAPLAARLASRPLLARPFTRAGPDPD